MTKTPTRPDFGDKSLRNLGSPGRPGSCTGGAADLTRARPRLDIRQ
jgi:hypothetical protein